MLALATFAVIFGSGLGTAIYFVLQDIADSLEKIAKKK